MSNNQNRFNMEDIETHVVKSDYMRQLRNQQMYNIPNLANVTMPSCDKIQSEETASSDQSCGERAVLCLQSSTAQSVACGKNITFDRVVSYGGGGLKYLENGDIEICRCGPCSLYFRIRSNPGSSSVAVFSCGEETVGGRFSAGFFETAITGRIIIPPSGVRRIISLRNVSDSTLRLSAEKCGELSASIIMEAD